MSNSAMLSSRSSVRPLQKCVDVKHIRDWVAEPDRRRIDIVHAWTIVKNNYCAALVSRGVCPIQCETCKEPIISMFGFEGATSPAGVLTWRAKDRSAKMIEHLIAAQKEAEFQAQESDQSPEALYASLFRKKDIDPLEELRKFYE